MWALRILTGPQAGQVYQLNSGENVLGRSNASHIVMANAGVSKQHATVYVTPDKILLQDMGSRNGTFINGVRVQNKQIQIGDKIALHDLIVEVIPLQEAMAFVQAQQASQNVPAVAGGAPNVPQVPGMPGAEMQPMQGDWNQPADDQNFQPPAMPAQPATLKDKALDYVENVAMPGVYQLPKVVEFRWVVAGFIFVYILVVTFLSVIPMIQLSKASIEQESRRRALTIARTLASNNQVALLRGNESDVTTRQAQLEEGVRLAMIVSQKDGHVIAPASRAGTFPDEPFIHSARKETKELVKQLDDTTIGASTPISYFSSDTGGYEVAAHAIVLYNMGSLAIDDGRTASLFIQTLAMALLIGALLFFFLYKLIEYPILQINTQLDTALKEGRDNLRLEIQFPAMAKLVENINSALTRAISGGAVDGSGAGAAWDRDLEAENLANLMGMPCLAIDAGTRKCLYSNEYFEAVTGMSAANLRGQMITAINDQALKLSIEDLIQQANSLPSNIATNTLDMSGDMYAVNCQAVAGISEIAYYLITMHPLDEE